MGNEYAKLSNQAKVLLLEEAVIENDVEKVKAVMKGCEKFVFTARALGIACLYGTLDVVKALVDGGAEFEYTYTPDLKRKYGAAYSTNNYTYPVNYTLMLAMTSVNVGIPKLCTNTISFHFGKLPKLKGKKNSNEDRAEIAEYLLDSKVKFDASELLYYAILWGCIPVAEILLKKGVELSATIKQLFLDTTSTIPRNELLATLSELSERDCLFALNTFAKLLGEEKMQLTQMVFDAKNTSFFNANVIECMFKISDTSSISKQKLLNKLIDRDDVEAMKLLIENETFKTPAQRDKAIEYARKNEKNNVLAWLMDYKNRNADIKAENEKAEAKMKKELTENPNSVSAMKKKWNYEVLKNGNLKITSYKGTETDVVIPSTIGKNTVVAIDENTFAIDSEYGCKVTKDQKENRKQIESIEFPGTINEIPDYMFLTRVTKYEKLKYIKLGVGIKKIGRKAFCELEKIEEIVIPDTVKEIKEYAFSDCSKLVSVILPSKLKKIGECAFNNCVKLKNIEIPHGLSELSAWLFSGSGLETFTFSKKINTIGEYVFEGCKSLKSIQWPDWINAIPKGTFKGSGIETFIMQDNVKSIGELAFASCEKLEKFEIDEDVEIKNNAFSGCLKFADENGMVIINGELFGVGEFDYVKSENMNGINPIKISNTIKIKAYFDTLPRFIHYECEEFNDKLPSDLSVGAEFELGRFTFTTNLELSPIRWKVLSVEGNKALCITTQPLFVCSKTLDKTQGWANSQIRHFLNEGFIEHYFTDKEKSIMSVTNNNNDANSEYNTMQESSTDDTMFLLSVDDIQRYMPAPEDRIVEKTEFIKKLETRDEYCNWITRSLEGDWENSTVAINEEGIIHKVAMHSHGKSVARPAMWIDLSKLKNA